MRSQAATTVTGFRSDNSVLGYGCKPIRFRKYNLSVNVSKELATEVPGPLSAFTPTYYSYVEHVGSAAHGFAEFGGCFQPPSLHIGCLPVHSYSTQPTDYDVQDITIIYKVDTMIEIEYSFDFIYPYNTMGNAHTLYTGEGDYITQHENTVNAYGCKCKIQSATGTRRATTSKP